MPWPCKIVTDYADAKIPGDMWPVLNEIDSHTDWYVLLPDGSYHNIHAKTNDGTGWDVSGEAPNFTVTPSINRHASYNHKGWHGYITNGILSDDYEGRTYDSIIPSVGNLAIEGGDVQWKD